MRIFYWQHLHDLIEIEHILKTEHIIAGETDTVIGLFANSTKEGLSQLNYIKNREKKPYICLVNTKAKAKALIDTSEYDLLSRVAPCIWPGPITAIFRVSSKYAYVSNKGTIAIRIPNHKEMLLLLDHFEALFSTSANISGQPTPQNLNEINKEIKSQISGFVQNIEQYKSTNTPSTIMRFEENKITILRGTLDKLTKQKLINAGFIV